jgi:hypothetical protein
MERSVPLVAISGQRGSVTRDIRQLRSLDCYTAAFSVDGKAFVLVITSPGASSRRPSNMTILSIRSAHGLLTLPGPGQPPRTP